MNALIPDQAATATCATTHNRRASPKRDDHDIVGANLKRHVGATLKRHVKATLKRHVADLLLPRSAQRHQPDTAQGTRTQARGMTKGRRGTQDF